MWCPLGLVRTDVSKQSAAYIFRVKRIRELGTTLAVTLRLKGAAKKDHELQLPTGLLVQGPRFEARQHSSSITETQHPTRDVSYMLTYTHIT
jgi:hypothetical protein